MEESDCKRCETQRDFLLQYSRALPPWTESGWIYFAEMYVRSDYTVLESENHDVGWGFAQGEYYMSEVYSGYWWGA